MNYQPNILASTLASKKPALFASLFPQPPSPQGYWNKPAIGIEKRIAELQQYSVRLIPFTFNQNDPATFVKGAENLIKLQPDGIILAPFFKKEALHFIRQLKKSRIPFVFIDSEIKGGGHLSYIGQDSYQSGRVSGQLLDLILPEGNVLVIHFAKEMDNQNHLVQREKGFYNWFSENNNSSHRLFTTEVPDTTDGKWMKTIRESIRKNAIQGIFVTNSRVFHVGRLIEKFNLKGIKVIGHDLIKENVGYLKKDVVHFLICQRPEEQGYNAINKLFRHVVQKREIDKEKYTSIDIVTKENVSYYKEFK